MDADRKKVVWKYLYSQVYTEDRWLFWRYIDFNVENLVGKNQAGIKNMNFQLENASPELEFVKKYKDIFTISGDTDFTISKDSSQYNEMYKFKNFSLMPCVGAMNDAKGRKPFVEFIRMLDTFYETKDVTPLFRAVGNTFKDEKREKAKRKRNKECLKEFLLLAGDNVIDYCSKMYFIDAELVKKIKEAKRDVDIIDEYWTQRQKLFAEKLRNTEWLTKNIELEIDEN